MQRRFVTVDVFTERMFGGNPLAVVLDAEGLDSAQMQAIAREFNYSETTFVLPPRAAGHTAQVRIFTPRVEVPFAGHPNVGTAVVLAHEFQARGAPAGGQFIFEELAGAVPVQLLRADGVVVGAELTAPEPLSRGAQPALAAVADCLSLRPDELRLASHAPQVISVGLPFLVAELVSLEALRRAQPAHAAHERLLPGIGTDGVYAYVRAPGAHELQARNFMPLDGCSEDPATGSAAGATIALLTALEPQPDCDRQWRISQGIEMGRPSLLLGRTVKRAGQVTSVQVAGRAVPVMQGHLR